MSNLPPRFITVHASATTPTMDIGAKEIRSWHLDRGWKDIGYHFIIRRNGEIEKGRDLNVIGAHVGNNNAKNIGICMVGGVAQHDTNKPEDNYTHKQYTTLTKLLADLLEKYPNVELKGHNDFPGYKSRGCPCFNHHVYFDWFRSALSSLYKPDDWFDNSKYDWHATSIESWKVPNTFFDAIDFNK